ncbi:MAG: glycosyltransferase family 4 protein [Proteobacteria bacterium]|nr:glycosyltransferase family 4 protein [Pseudomonadota bacterium]
MPQKKLKILHLLSQRPDSTGSGFYLQAMLRESLLCNHQNFLLAGIQSDQPVNLDCIKENRCEFVKFSNTDVSCQIPGMSDVMPYESSRFSCLSPKEINQYLKSFTEKLKKTVASFKPDIIHSHHLWIVTSLARQLFPNIPIVTTCHGTDLRQFNNCPHLQEMVLEDCRKTDAVMALYGAQKTDIINLYNISEDKIFVVGAGYNEQLFTPAPKPDPNPVQLVYAGKLSNAKGVPWLLRALSTVDFPSWRLHLVGSGSGEERDYCIELAKNLGERVIVHGAVSQKDLADIMKQSHVFVLPSFYEGLPLVLLEGLACGCRIVATDLPGVSELLGNINADFISMVKTPRLNIDIPYKEDEDLFEKNLAHALNTQILASLKNPGIDISVISDKIASYSWTGVFNKVQQIYYTVLKRYNNI